MEVGDGGGRGAMHFPRASRRGSFRGWICNVVYCSPTLACFNREVVEQTDVVIRVLLFSVVFYCIRLSCLFGVCVPSYDRPKCTLCIVSENTRPTRGDSHSSCLFATLTRATKDFPFSLQRKAQTFFLYSKLCGPMGMA